MSYLAPFSSVEAISILGLSDREYFELWASGMMPRSIRNEFRPISEDLSAHSFADLFLVQCREALKSYFQEDVYTDSIDETLKEILEVLLGALDEDRGCLWCDRSPTVEALAGDCVGEMLGIDWRSDPILLERHRLAIVAMDSFDRIRSRASLFLQADGQEQSKVAAPLESEYWHSGVCRQTCIFGDGARHMGNCDHVHRNSNARKLNDPVQLNLFQHAFGGPRNRKKPS